MDELSASLQDAYEYYERRAKKWHSRFLVSAQNKTSGARCDADVAACEAGYMAEIKSGLEKVQRK